MAKEAGDIDEKAIELTSKDIVDNCNKNVANLNSTMDEMVNLKLGNNWMDNAVDTTNLIKLIEKCKSVGALGIRTEALDLWKYDTDQEWKNECDKLANELDKNLKLLQEEIARLHLKWQL